MRLAYGIDFFREEQRGDPSYAKERDADKGIYKTHAFERLVRNGDTVHLGEEKEVVREPWDKKQREILMQVRSLPQGLARS